MRKHLKYLMFLLRHKWYVAKFCFRYGLYWQGIIHDWSKFLPDEWFPYVDYFYGGPYPIAREVPGDFRWQVPTKELVQERFDLAWLKHQHRNPHHWQHWILRGDDGAIKPLYMPDRYWYEMIADWRGAGMAISGADNTLDWYAKNRDKIQLHPGTRAWIEWQLAIISKSST